MNAGRNLKLCSRSLHKYHGVVEYSLAGYKNPIGVAEWRNQMVKVLPEELKSSLPSIEEIEKELE